MPPRTFTFIAMAAALAGFVVVYATVWPTGNEVAPPHNVSVPDEAATKPAAGPASTSPEGSVLAGLNTGQMANFVIHKTPRDVPDLTFVDGADQPKSLADWSGQVVLLNLWATWCGPCRHEMPSLDRLEAALGGNGFEVVALSIDKGGLERPRKFLEDIKVEKLKLYLDPTSKAAVKLRAVGMPTTLLLGPDGKELGRLVGPAEWDSDEAKALIRAALTLKASG